MAAAGVRSGVANALIDPEATTLPKKSSENVVFALHAVSVGDARLRKLKQSLAAWMNSYLVKDKLYVRDVHEDLQDGQLLLSFLEKLTKRKLDIVVGGAQGAAARRANLHAVETAMREDAGLEPEDGWVEGIMNQDYVSILRLLIMLAHKYHCPFHLPSHVDVVVVHRERLKGGGELSKTSKHQITGDESIFNAEADANAAANAVAGLSLDAASHEDGSGNVRDAFDDLFDEGMEGKLQHVTNLLVAFINAHLEVLGAPAVTDLAAQLSDGVLLIQLIGVLGGFFVPFYNYKDPATTDEDKLANVAFAFKLMHSLQVPPAGVAAQDVVDRKLPAIMRLLYQLFMAFQSPAAV